MKKPFFLAVFLVVTALFPVQASYPAQSEKENPMIIAMTINQKTYAIELADNPTAKAFIEQLPLKLMMEELNGNEKFADLPRSLPTGQSKPVTIHKGDLMLYGRQTLVLFYETFRTSYSYTPIGKMTVPDNLKKMVGNKNIEATFTMTNFPQAFKTVKGSLTQENNPTRIVTVMAHYEK